MEAEVSDKDGDDLAKMFERMLPGWMSEQGMRMAHMLSLKPSPNEGEEPALTIAAIDLSTGGPYYLLRLAHQVIETDGVAELIVGFDRYVEPGQPNPYNDFITLFHWREGTPWRYGVIDYKPLPNLMIDPTIWEHPYWAPNDRRIHQRWAAREASIIMATVIVEADGTKRYAVKGYEGVRQRETPMTDEELAARAIPLCA